VFLYFIHFQTQMEQRMALNLWRTSLLAVTLSVVFVPDAQAEEVIGTISAEFDGTTFRESTVHVSAGGDSMATATVTRHAGLTMISIYSAGSPQISVEFMYGAQAAPGPDDQPLSATVSLFPAGIWPHWTSEEAPTPLRVSLDVLDISGPVGRAEGKFEGALCYVESQRTEADSGNCKPVSGRFATDLHDESMNP